MPLEAPIKARAKREDGTGPNVVREDKESGALNGERGMIASLGSASLARDKKTRALLPWLLL